MRKMFRIPWWLRFYWIRRPVELWRLLRQDAYKKFARWWYGKCLLCSEWGTAGIDPLSISRGGRTSYCYRHARKRDSEYDLPLIRRHQYYLFGWIDIVYKPEEACVVKRWLVLCATLLPFIIMTLTIHFYFWEIVNIASINLHICGKAFREIEKWGSLCLLRDIALPMFWISIVLVVIALIVITFQTTRKGWATIQREVDRDNRKLDDLIERAARQKFGVSSSFLSDEEFSDVLDIAIDRAYPKTETPKLWWIGPS